MPIISKKNKKRNNKTIISCFSYMWLIGLLCFSHAIYFQNLIFLCGVTCNENHYLKKTSIYQLNIDKKATSKRFEIDFVVFFCILTLKK